MPPGYAGALKTNKITEHEWSSKVEVIYGLIPSMIIIGLILVVILFWAIKTGQFDDLEGDAHRILMDEDLTPVKNTQETEASSEQTEKNISDKADNNKEKG